jgi:hypothetical protein
MRFNALKKNIVSLVLMGSFLLGIGAVSDAFAQSRRQRERRQERLEERYERRAERLARARERLELNRIRQLDRQRQLRYQYYRGNRLVGYYDRWGNFQPVGYYDRYGRFWRYL